MKIIWSAPETEPREKRVRVQGKSFTVNKVAVGHNAAEVFFRLDETMILMTPGAAKRLARDLKSALSSWEARHGRIAAPATRKRGAKRESTAKRAIKSLYKSRKVNPKLISVNTSRRKHLPPKED